MGGGGNWKNRDSNSVGKWMILGVWAMLGVWTMLGAGTRSACRQQQFPTDSSDYRKIDDDNSI